MTSNFILNLLIVLSLINISIAGISCNVESIVNNTAIIKTNSIDCNITNRDICTIDFETIINPPVNLPLIISVKIYPGSIMYSMYSVNTCKITFPCYCLISWRGWNPSCNTDHKYIIGLSY